MPSSERSGHQHTSKSRLRQDYGGIPTPSLEAERRKSGAGEKAKLHQLPHSRSESARLEDSNAPESASSKRSQHKPTGRRNKRHQNDHRDRHLATSSKITTGSKPTTDASETSTSEKTSAYLCTICNNSFKWYEKLQDHRLLHQRERKPLPCYDCKEAFWTKYHFEQHLCEPEKSISSWDERSSDSANFKYGERRRSRSFGRTGSRSRGKTECFVCHRKFENKGKMMAHKKRSHSSSTGSKKSGSSRSRERVERIKRVSLEKFDEFDRNTARQKQSRHFNSQGFLHVV